MIRLSPETEWITALATNETIQVYSDRAKEFADRYESLSFESVYSDSLDLLPVSPALVLDVGAGSGRDAAWFADRGSEVVAIEPAVGLLEEAKQLHPDERIRWLVDKLPALEKTLRLGLSFDLILLNAVWMHIAPDDRMRAFRKLVSLLKPGGKLIISLRHGTFDDSRVAYPVSIQELERLARQQGVALVRSQKSVDRLGREYVQWETVCLQLPDDGTHALPLLRHIILNDSKSSTYKLALLRVLVRIADGAVGVTKEVDDDTVAVPLGLVSLYWVRMYKPLIERRIPQKPSSKDQRGLSFVREGFENVASVSPYELRPGATFVSDRARWLRSALVDTSRTIAEMPAYYIKYPNSQDTIFKAKRKTPRSRDDAILLDRDFLWAFGELNVPRHLWLAMTRYASWIEPVLITEWIRLMQFYSESHGFTKSWDELQQLLTWLEPERDTSLVRGITQKMFSDGKPLYCTWSGKRLSIQNCDIDHCFPFCAWPCGDLWNLLPALRSVNQHQKGDKLITSSTLYQAKQRLLEWWEQAYLSSGPQQLAERFRTEVSVSLPVVGDLSGDSTFEALMFKRAALKQDLQLQDWDWA